MSSYLRCNVVNFDSFSLSLKKNNRLLKAVLFNKICKHILVLIDTGYLVEVPLVKSKKMAFIYFSVLPNELFIKIISLNHSVKAIVRYNV